MKKLLVFTDLDGTLLDHESYSYQAAWPAIQLLQQNDYPLIINSSKTYREVAAINGEMGITHPFIIENGSAIVVPIGQLANREAQDKIIPCGESYQNIIHRLQQLRKQHAYAFSGFYDLTLEEIMQLTNLDREQAMGATQRHASEPILWQGDERSLQHFKSELEKSNLQLIKGGRFYHVMGHCNKGTALDWMVEQYRLSEPQIEWHTVALGDSPNDLPMLSRVDYPVLVKNNNTNQADMPRAEKTIATEDAGPRGWNNAILELIKNFKD